LPYGWAWALAVHAKPAARTSAGIRVRCAVMVILTIRRGTLPIGSSRMPT